MSLVIVGIALLLLGLVAGRIGAKAGTALATALVLAWGGCSRGLG